MEETYHHHEDKYMAQYNPELQKRYSGATSQEGTLKLTRQTSHATSLPPGVSIEGGHSHTLREADLLKHTLPYGHTDVSQKANVGYLHRHIYESPQFS